MRKLLLTHQYNFEEIVEVAERLQSHISYPEIILFKGDLGAGKTTLIKALLKTFKIEEPVSSPTYSIVNVYGDESKPIYHMDLYRLKHPEEALDIGILDMLEDGLCLIEWPEIIDEYLPEYYFEIELENLSTFERLIHFYKISPGLHE